MQVALAFCSRFVFTLLFLAKHNLSLRIGLMVIYRDRNDVIWACKTRMRVTYIVSGVVLHCDAFNLLPFVSVQLSSRVKQHSDLLNLYCRHVREGKRELDKWWAYGWCCQVKQLLLFEMIKAKLHACCYQVRWFNHFLF